MEITNNEKNSCCNPNSIMNVLKITDIRIFIDESKCTSCGLCEEICPFGLPKLSSKGKYEIKQPELCTECSACYRNCPVQAIIMEEQKGCGCLWDARQRYKSNDNNKKCSC